MKWIKLLESARVNGVLRHPHEGVLHLEDEEAQRLLDNKAGEDVSDDFSARQDAAPAEGLSEAQPETPHPASEPHQSEVAPQAAEDHPAPRRRAGASKE